MREVEFLASHNASLRFRLRKPLAIYPRCGLNGLLLRRATWTHSMSALRV